MTRPAVRGRRRRPAASLAALAAVIALLLAGALPASAHNTLVSSDPAAGAVVAALPDTVSLTFDQPVQREFLTVVLTPDGGTAVPLTATASGPTVTAVVTDTARQALTVGSDRAVRLGYRVVSADDHPISGSVDFTVGTAAQAFGSSQAAAPTTVSPATGTASGTTWWPWALGVPVAAALVLLLAVTLRRRRKARPTPDGVPRP